MRAILPPTVSGIDPDLLREGEPVSLDGGLGTVELPGVLEIPVVTSFLETRDGRLLLLKRSPKVGSFPGRWAGVSGTMEGENPEAEARREIREETGVGPDRLRLLSSGACVYVREGKRVYTVRPFRFRVSDRMIRLNWEHTEAAWVRAKDIGRRKTVPKLAQAYRATLLVRVPPDGA